MYRYKPTTLDLELYNPCTRRRKGKEKDGEEGKGVERQADHYGTGQPSIPQHTRVAA